MKKLPIVLALFSQVIGAQESLHNLGNLKIHENGAIGFHSNLINNGSFDENLGLAGFFNGTSTSISGTFRPVFNDLEVMVRQDLFLEVGIGIERHLNFIDGTITTPRAIPDVTTDFLEEAIYSGQRDAAKVDGYAAMVEKQQFLFPVGDTERLRPLQLELANDSITATCAYFFENPNTPKILIDNFDTQILGDNVQAVSTAEFWHLKGISSGKVEIQWDDRSTIGNFVDRIEQLTIVGWHVGKKEWHDLGIAAQNGDMAFGRMVSDYFDLAVYPILTFGRNTNPMKPLRDNYLITLNNDGINDYLVIPAVEQSPNNLLKIFNRWGRAVYIDENYRNDFNGKNNTDVALRKSKNLPIGLYFYVIELKDLDTSHQGYLYINE